MRFAFVTLALLALFGQAIAHSPQQARYLGNEGILVTHGDTKVLFDAFYADSYGQFVLVPEQITKAINEGTPPYDGIDAVFVSHVHGDHFSAAPVIAFLRKHPTVKLYGPSQVVDALRSAGVDGDDPLNRQLTTFDLWPQQSPVQLEVEGLAMEVVAVPHAGNRPNVQNYVWRVTLDEHTTVMHLGDADPNPIHFTRHSDHFQKRRSHHAFPPFWFFSSEGGRRILQTLLNAEQITGIHVPAEARGKGDEWREQLKGDVFTDPGETRELSRE